MTEEESSADPHQRFSLVEVEILCLRTMKKMTVLERVPSLTKISDLKDIFEKKFPNYYPSRQSFRLDKRSKILKDSDTLASLNLTNECTLYFDDLGAQIGWRTVFLVQYLPPIFLYLFFYFNIPYKYVWNGYTGLSRKDDDNAVFLACICYCGHFTRRVIETLIVHRFNSYTTMRAMRLIKNCTFYWGTTLFLAYFINHPLYTSPAYGKLQSYGGFLCFWACQFGILSVHVVFRKTKTPSQYSQGNEAIGVPASGISKLKRGLSQPIKANPFTWLIKCVVCPNYTYEFFSWLAFCFVTQSIVTGAYTILVFIQMVIWAGQKKHNYQVEFRDYPKNISLLLPFLI